jgi:hypothetical protein
MTSNPNYPYILLGLLALLLIVQWAWCSYVAYPISFERKLKRGKPWVYIPIRWKGSRKFQVVTLTRLLMAAIVAVGALSLGYFTKKSEAPWMLVYVVALGFLVMRLNTFWLDFRYRQQEDSYYFLHDELRAKLEGEGKDMAESAFKSLAAYQHQNLLRKADESGTLLKTLKNQAKISRKYRKEVRTRETVET